VENKLTKNLNGDDNLANAAHLAPDAASDLSDTESITAPDTTKYRDHLRRCANLQRSHAQAGGRRQNVPKTDALPDCAMPRLRVI